MGLRQDMIDRSPNYVPNHFQEHVQNLQLNSDRLVNKDDSWLNQSISMYQ